eukprot:CAMPEP_0184486752 /NCGR_PEP_ID=MMETSP0113_2-20130426/8532_1 /TAXON_ID=91329 /ORGANISM="Norrisiella sphaerica, Strain BC52" /LENGTH=399 /DNA_ID=CAMNT_0026868775 /DNA_START=16 /DNA_END=1215 /DNA_ORIENTATION=+
MASSSPLLFRPSARRPRSLASLTALACFAVALGLAFLVVRSSSSVNEASWVGAGIAPSSMSRVASVVPSTSSLTSCASTNLNRNLAVRSNVAAVRQPLVAANAAYATVRGSSRENNEDRISVVQNPNAAEGEIEHFYAVYDGHGGDGTSMWLTENLFKMIKDRWSSKDPKSSLIRAYEDADEDILQPRGGVFGIGAQRGVGGAKCGSTAATVVTYKMDGKRFAAVANIGDSAVIKKGANGIEELTTEHVPDNEEERKRIEMYNPNPKMPLVRFVEKTWRVGGLLALSRAFGDAYLKPSLDFEGIGYQDADYMSGFGLIARPDVEVIELSPSDEWMVIASDGLYETENRGGGGGLTNTQIEEIVSANKGATPEQISTKLVAGAQQAGSTDDISVIFVPLA